MGIYYKIDVMEELKKRGWNTLAVRRDKLLPSSAVVALRKGLPISFDSLFKICEILGLQPGDIIGARIDRPYLTKQEEDELWIKDRVAKLTFLKSQGYTDEEAFALIDKQP